MHHLKVSAFHLLIAEFEDRIPHLKSLSQIYVLLFVVFVDIALVQIDHVQPVFLVLVDQYEQILGVGNASSNQSGPLCFKCKLDSMNNLVVIRIEDHQIIVNT